jgi:hypothetical protein
VKPSAMPPYAAYLRVYEPVDAVDAAVAAAWRERPDSSSADPASGYVLERMRGLTGLLATPPATVPAHDGVEAFALEDAGQVYLCPWDTRLRCWVALEELRNTVPEPVLNAFVPRVVVDVADADFAGWRAAHPNASPHILTSSWQVPLRWFVAFSPTERTLVPASPGGVARLFYRTSMADARRRVARALQVLRRTMESGPLASGVADLGRWLEEFHPRSRIELDYGGLVRLISVTDLEADTSVADVHAALSALASGDGEAAVERYRHLVDRWRAVGNHSDSS